MPLHTSFHAESDADDEFERSVVASATADSDDSLSDDPPEPTPTFGHERRPPNTMIVEWTANECADFLVALGLRQYCDTFLGKHLGVRMMVSDVGRK